MKRIIFMVTMVAVLQHIAAAQNNNFDFSAISNGKTLYYKINGSNVSVTYPRSNAGNTNFYVGYAKPQGELIIPSSVTHNGITYNVDEIDGKAFFYCNGITGITVPNTVQSIGDSAFTGCSNLTSVFLGNSIVSIGYAAFRGCSHLPSIVLPAALASIDNYAFFACPMLKKIGVLAITPPIVTGNTLTADTLVLRCNAMDMYQQTFPWSARFATVIGFNDDLPRVYDTVTALCSYLWHGTNYYESNDSIVFAGVQQWACDSLYILNLTIDNTSFETFDTMTLCHSMLPYQFADTVLGSDAESGDYTFFRTSVDGCDSVVYLNLTIHESEQTELCMVSVDEGHNTLMWNKGANVARYNIYRESDVAGQYDFVAEVAFDSLSQWVDVESRPISRSYRYRISSVDSCGVESEMSDIHKTMHLTINRGVGSSWNLVWSEYEGADYSTYMIYRGTRPDEVELIDQMPAIGNTTYTDPDVNSDTVFYQVAIVKNEPCFPTKAASIIRSNIASNQNNAIESIDTEGVVVYSSEGCIIVDCANQKLVKIYDVAGHQLSVRSSEGQPLCFDIPASGTYFVKVGNAPAHRLVVIR